MLHELEKELAQAQTMPMKKEMELEKQQLMATELQIAIQEAEQNKCKVECGALQAEVQRLKDCLEDAQQQQKLAGETPSSTDPTTLPTHGAEQPLSLSKGPLPSASPLSHSKPSQDLTSHLSSYNSLHELLHSLPPSPSLWNLLHIAGARLGKENCPLFSQQLR